MDVTVDRPLLIRVDFVDAHGYDLTGVNTVKYTLYGHSGSAIRQDVAVSVAENAKYTSISLLSSDNTISGSRRFEKRQLFVSWLSQGNEYTVVKRYRILPFLNYSVAYDDVRALLGLNSDDLNDDEIDIFSAFLSIDGEITTSVLTTALASGTSLEMSANRLIAIEAALLTIPSLELRTAASVVDGNRRWDRFRTPPDWNAIASRLGAMKAQALATITETAQDSPTLTLMSTPTDVITGA